MKLLLENWRKFINENDEFSDIQKIASMVTDAEGFLSALAIAESLDIPLKEWVVHISRKALVGELGVKSFLEDPRIPSGILLWFFKKAYFWDQEIDYGVANKISKENSKVLKMLKDNIENLDSDSAELVSLIKEFDRSHLDTLDDYIHSYGY
jgi:hypothetical protein